AAGGTLFLDEVGELGPALQTKLLSALETTSFRRVGGTHDLATDVRVIAATNRHLEADVAAGRFRLDLFHRLDVFHLTLPPLRERREDIRYLAHWLLGRIAQRLGRHAPRLSPEAERVVVAYDFPGNVRELRNVLERALILESGPEITPASLALGRSARPPSAGAEPFFQAPLGEDGRPPTLAELERDYVVRLLAHTRGNRAEVARLLKVSYPTVAKKIADYGIEVPD
ncbi:MAG TPA: sigma 54-interacting transcriptional regulator, partial [Anaeromyxobacteraceae bacterium]|nr:sigma 54-interacting transcriptional regulator [Anaeromyxobacteraceae bacterium]